MTMNLFDKTAETQLSKGTLGAGTTLLRGFVLQDMPHYWPRCKL